MRKRTPWQSAIEVRCGNRSLDFKGLVCEDHELAGLSLRGVGVSQDELVYFEQFTFVVRYYLEATCQSRVESHWPYCLAYLLIDIFVGDWLQAYLCFVLFDF